METIKNGDSESEIGWSLSLRILSAFKGRGDFFQQLPDRQVLGTNLFAFAAADAGRSFAMTLAGDDVVIVVPCIPVVEGFVRIQR